ncbi:Actin filament-associated protein 1-like 2 [Saguinus oedipus]|uniref:Actin filament-associated protein 1-like 2 n=1 Tax=Saguinus oedipus TaxID=9490 RepID=A0ABQ9UPM6_SAGOE|nr:Actin filament-associated protein 1-like 2 [Saguinus oedipus]
MEVGVSSRSLVRPPLSRQPLITGDPWSLVLLPPCSRLMQRKFSEPNTYIDGLPSQDRQEELYDDVELSELTAVVRTQLGSDLGLSRLSPENLNAWVPEIIRVEPTEEAIPAADDPSKRESDRVYLDLTPVKSFLHGSSGAQAQASSPTLSRLDNATEALPAEPDPGPTPHEPCIKCPESLEEQQLEGLEPEEPSLRIPTVKIQTEQQRISFPPSCPDTLVATPPGASPPVKDRLRVTSAEIKLGKNRTEAEVKRYTEEKERLEKKKEEIRGHLAQLRKEKRELKETLLKCTELHEQAQAGLGQAQLADEGRS